MEQELYELYKQALMECTTLRKNFLQELEKSYSAELAITKKILGAFESRNIKSVPLTVALMDQIFEEMCCRKTLFSCETSVRDVISEVAAKILKGVPPF